jgi:O-antigen/teichoic acid export membrane protein
MVQTWSLQVVYEIICTKILRRKFVRDVGVLTVANVMVATLSFVQGIVVARWLGPELYGITVLVMSYPNLLYAFFDARSVEVSMKYLAEFHAHQERDRALAMCKMGYTVDFMIAVLAFLVVLFTSSWVSQKFTNHPEAAGLMLVYATAFLPRALLGTSHAVLATLGKFSIIAWVDVTMTMLRVILVVSFTLTGWQVAGIIWGDAIALGATGLLCWGITRALICRTWGTYPLQGNLYALKGRYREICGFLVYNDVNALMGMLSKQLDVVLLGYFRNPSEVGYYKLAKSLAGVVGYLIAPLQQVTYSDLARLVGSGRKQTSRLKVRRIALQVGAPLGIATLVGTLFAPWVVPALVGASYLPAVTAMQVLSIGAAIRLAFFWLRPLFLAHALLKQWTIFGALFALCTFIGWLVVVPEYGYLGMSIWFLLSTVCVYIIPPSVLLFITGRL